MLSLEQRNELINLLLLYVQSEDDELPKNIEQMFAADWALALESTPSDFRPEMWLLVPQELRNEALMSMREETRHELLKGLEKQQIIDATQQATSEQAVNLITQLPLSTANEVIASIKTNEQSASITAAMEYDSKEVGRHAVRDFFTLSAISTVSEAKKSLTMLDASMLHHYIFLTDTRGKFVGKVTVAALWHTQENTVLSALALGDDEYVRDTELTNNLGAIFKRFDASQLPVLDGEHRIIGIFYAQDVIAHMESRFQSEFAHAGNVNDEDLFASVFSSAKQRALWLGINLLTAILAAQVIGIFETALDAVVALAVLMPIVASMGGIAGSQTLTLTIRGLATNQLSNANISLLRNKEFKVALINSVIWAVAVSAFAYFWFEKPMLSFILGFAVMINMVTAVLSGIAIPYIMHKMKIDPALAGSVVLTTISDVVGFFVFLGLATLLLL